MARRSRHIQCRKRASVKRSLSLSLSLCLSLSVSLHRTLLQFSSNLPYILSFSLSLSLVLSFSLSRYFVAFRGIRMTPAERSGDICDFDTSSWFGEDIGDFARPPPATTVTPCSSDKAGDFSLRPSPRSHRCRCGRASLCGHGHGGRACRVVRGRERPACDAFAHACDVFASPAADAPSRARRLCRADARSSGEGAARPRLCADEAGESWSVGPGASRLHTPLFVACGCSGVANPPCSARYW
jgi:hypothetical protein